MQREERAFQPEGTGWRAPRRAGETRDQGVPVREKSTYRGQRLVGSKAGEVERGSARP